MPDRIATLKDFLDSRFSGQVAARLRLPARPGEFAPLPEGLDPRLAAALAADGITRLYSHQAEAFGPISRNRDTLLVSHTASGKTLSFFLPILNEYCAAPAPFSVLLLYPTKALSRDQETTFGRLLRTAGREGALGVFDGDTPVEARNQVRRRADFVISNPDMLHNGILPNHNRGWRDFLARLRYLVVDEVHMYRGAFGSHVANVFRRLARVAAQHGGSPCFVASSATVGNPGELAEALFHRPFTVVDRDGAPRPERELYLVNPPLVQGDGFAAYRKGPSSVSAPLIEAAVKAGVRTICFCRARQEAERLVRMVTDRERGLARVVKPYRGGLLPNERRALERDLAEGRLSAVVSTNALELGIDIGDLELCILSGHPGSIAGFWQQAGRVGRKGNRSLVVFIAKDAPIDQYLVHHPEFLTGAPVEQAWLAADNPYILLQHLPCMAAEYPLASREPGIDELVYGEALAALQKRGVLVPYGELFRYALEDYPARGVNLRGMTDYNVEIYCGSEVIGELDPIGARGTLYKDAIYQHLGRRYMSLDLDLEKKLCRVAEVEVDYFTEAVWEGRLEMPAVEETHDVHGALVEFGPVRVNKQPKLYKKIRERSFENIGYGPITLAAFEYETTGFALRPAPAWREALEATDKRLVGAALYGLAYILRRTAPGICMADISNVETDVALAEEREGGFSSALYLYDTIEGGVGYAEKIFENLALSLRFCRDVLTECECRAGCPSCVPSLPPGVDDEALEAWLVETDAARVATLSLLAVLLDGKVLVPSVATHRTPRAAPAPAPADDPRREKARRQLSRAADALERKRQREH